jgi:hypothetical protein
MNHKKIDQFIDKVVYIKTSNGLYLKVEDIDEHNFHATFVFTINRTHASEFILVKHHDDTINIRLNLDMRNQNNTFGYHLYVLPVNDIVYGSGNTELYAQFVIEQHGDYVLFKSAYKESYLSYEYNILRCRPKNEFNNFFVEEIHIPIIQRSICIMTYGYIRNPMDLNKAPIIDDLKTIYPQSQIDLYIFTPEVLDEFCNVTFDKNLLTSSKCNISVITHKNDIKYFMKIAYSQGLPIISNKNKNYSYRTISQLWNMSESVKNMLVHKKMYNLYILMRNDQFNTTRLFKKLIDTTKLYCLSNFMIDSHIFIGKDISLFNFLYDFYIRNKNTYAHEIPDKIICDFLCSHKVKLGNIHHVTPFINYNVNTKKLDDSFYKMVVNKYQEISGITMNKSGITMNKFERPSLLNRVPMSKNL